MSTWAKPGVKVVCILAGKLPESSSTARPRWEPVVGHVYTILAVEHFDGHLGFALEEQLEAEWMYSARRFRPLITKSQEDDVALFRSLLDALPVGEDA